MVMGLRRPAPSYSGAEDEDVSRLSDLNLPPDSFLMVIRRMVNSMKTEQPSFSRPERILEDKMLEADRRMRNEIRLLELYPAFRVRIEKVIVSLEAKGIRPRIQDAWRSPAKQEKAFKSGHSQLLFGFHNVTASDGAPQALAVDLVDDDSPLSPSKNYLLQLAAAVEAAGLITGIRWGLPEELIGAIDAAIAAQDWDANVKAGWDPAHVQPTGISVAQAKAGMRPA